MSQTTEQVKRRDYISMAIKVFLGIALFLLVCLGILHIPSVQKKIANFVSSKVIEKTGGQIEIGHAQFDIYQGVVLKKIVLIDNQSDTLLTLQSLSISPKNTLYSLIKKLSFNDLNLDGLKLNVVRKENETYSNWQNFIASFGGGDSTSSGSADLSLNHFEIYNVEVDFRDVPNNLMAHGTIDGLEIEIGQIDSTILYFKRISAIAPTISIDNISESIIAQIESKTSNDSTTSTPLLIPAFKIDQLNLVHANFTGNLPMGGSNENRKLDDISLLLSNVDFDHIDQWSGQIDDFSGRNKYYELKHLSVAKVQRSPGLLTLEKAFIRIDNSIFDFDTEVTDLNQIEAIADATMHLKVNMAKVRLSDLFPLFPKLEKDFGKEPLSQKFVQIEGDYHISKKEVEGDAIKIWLDRKHYFEGQGIFTKSGAYKESLLNFEIKNLNVDFNLLATQLKKIKVPEELKRLGGVHFYGTFDGFLNDFVAQGNLTTELGQANMDIQFDLGRSNKDSIGYAGYLALDSFDLSRLLLNDDFGIATAQMNIEKGVGTDFANSSAILSAVISQFDFKGYSYHDAQFKGELSSKVIDGHFEIQDESLDFKFDGVVDLSKEEPIFDFNVDATNIDFCQLNLAKFPCQLSFKSDINIHGNSLKNIAGKTILTDLKIHHDTSELLIQNLTINSERLDQDNMSFSLTSDYLDADFKGNFNLLNLYQSMARQFMNNHEQHMGLIQVKDNFGELSTQSFTYQISLKESAPIFDFFRVPLIVSDNTRLRGELREELDFLSLALTSVYAEYDNIRAENISLLINSTPDQGKIDVSLQKVNRDNISLEHAYFVTDIKTDELIWAMDYKANEYNRIELESKSSLKNGGYFTEFLYDNVVIDSSVWTILPNPGVGIYPKELDIENFIVTDGRRSVGIKDFKHKGIDLTLKEFDFSVINPFINYDKLYFDGSADAQIRIDDIYEKKGIEGFLKVPNFTINEESFGELLINAKRQADTLVDLDLSITKDVQNLFVKGYLNTDSKYVDVSIDIQKYPMDFFEYIINEGISETIGTTDITAKIYGNIDDINTMKLTGVGLVKDGGVRIDYIGAFYRLGDQPIKLSERFIDFNGVSLIDERNNTALVSGGLRHRFLADFRADVRITSPQFIALNTTKEDNPIYYGTGMGRLDASFVGPFDALDMRVTAEAGEFSTLYIPITSTQYGYDQSFINFDYNKENSDSLSMQKLVERLKASGVDFEMNLTFKREAEVQVIYDEETSNILLGHGEGDMRIAVKRDGEFTVFGQYDVESGEYLYTAFGFIAKPFVIKQGGTVTWTGDPINATLDIQAYYPGLRAPLNVLLREYVNAASIGESEFKQRRNVDLTLALTENLFNPAINFNISFPDLVGELKTLADAKVRTLRATENGINNQVVGLMVFRNFLPDNNPFANLSGNDIGQAGSNTITEFLTSQLSLLASDYLSSKLEGGIISGIDFEIALAQNSNFDDLPGTTNDGFINFVPDEVQLNLRNEFKNDNFVLNIGGNYVRQNPLNTANNYLTGDFSIDWFITEDKRLKLRFYGVYDYDETALARREKYGFGINYRREFGKLTEQSFEDVLDNVAKEVKVAVEPEKSLK